jgi:transposase
VEEKGITWVGLDAHKAAINVAMFLPGSTKPVEWQLTNDAASVRRMVRKIERRAPGEVRFCYEAGPCGYSLQRQIIDAGKNVSCMVVAPALIPRKPGERIKTDRRDARKLGELFRAGLLTEVHPPTQENEAARDLCRAREDAREDLMRSRHRLGKLLLRRSINFDEGKKAWSQRHRIWLRGLRFELPADRKVFEDYLLAIEQLEERLRGLDSVIEQLSHQPEYEQAVGALRCFRGVDTTTAMIFVTELYGFARFTSARGLMAFLGLVPSEHSSSDSRRQGGITKAGNGHVRRVVIEAAWHYRHPPRVASLKKRREGQPPRVIAIADKAMQRLNRRFARMAARGIPSNKITVAVARELAGFLWAALQPAA